MFHVHSPLPTSQTRWLIKNTDCSFKNKKCKGWEVGGWEAMQATKSRELMAQQTSMQRQCCPPPPPCAPSQNSPWAGQGSALHTMWTSELAVQASSTFYFCLRPHLCGSFHSEQEGRGRALVKVQSSGSKLGVPGGNLGGPPGFWNYMQVLVLTHLLCISLVKASMISSQTKWITDTGKSIKKAHCIRQSLDWKKYTTKAKNWYFLRFRPLYTEFLLKASCGPRKRKSILGKEIHRTL